jgi:hypothetical protein
MMKGQKNIWNIFHTLLYKENASITFLSLFAFQFTIHFLLSYSFFLHHIFWYTFSRFSFTGVEDVHFS